jgi:hypothetical protein
LYFFLWNEVFERGWLKFRDFLHFERIFDWTGLFQPITNMLKKTVTSFWPQVSTKTRDYAETLRALESLIVSNVPRSDRPKDVTNESNVDAMTDYLKRLSIDVSPID